MSLYTREPCVEPRRRCSTCSAGRAPAVPTADAHGYYPAIETARVVIARQVIRARKAAGWTQAQLAARAGVRPETISRIETGKHSPGMVTMGKIDRALKRAGV